MTLFQCSVPGKPVPQSRPKIVRATGRVYYGKRSTAQRKLLYGAFLEERVQGMGVVGVPCRVTVEVAGLHGNGDLDNAAKLVLDALVDAGVLLTDKATTVRELVVRAVDGEPRTDVRIEAMA